MRLSYRLRDRNCPWQSEGVEALILLVKSPSHILRRKAGLIAVMALALGWRLLFAVATRDTPLAAWYTWDQTDMHAYWQQAQALASGDWLARTPIVPQHVWMGVATLEAWHAWFNPHVFYQAPLYSYFLAVLIRIGLDAAVWPAMLQALVGVINAGLMYALTRRIFGRRAALFAGLFMAVYGPMIVVESQMLRETFLMFFILLAFLSAAPGMLRPGAAARPLHLLIAGLLIGILAMLQEATAYAVLGGLAGAKVLSHFTRPSASRAATSALHFVVLLVLGAMVGFIPLLARNLAVGAPVLSQSSASGMTWVMANRAAAPSGGVTWDAPTADFAEIMTRAEGRPTGMFIETLRSYEGRWWLWLLHWKARAFALLVGPEAPDNTSYAFFRIHVPILSLSLDFRWLFPIGGAGIVLWLWRKKARALVRHRLQAALLIYGLLSWAAISGVYPLGRYRLFFLPVLAPFAGWLLAGLWRIRRADESIAGKKIFVRCSVIALLVLFQWGLGLLWPALGNGLRAQDFIVAGRMLTEWGRPDLAVDELSLASRHAIRDATLDAELKLNQAILCTAQNQDAQAATLLDSAAAESPQHAAILTRLALLRATSKDPKVRNPPQALELAGQVQQIRRSDAASLDLLAVAQFAAGDKASAIQSATQAEQLARREGRDDLAQAIAKRLADYRATK